MTLVGYPDWERVQREGGDLVSIVSQIITTPIEIGPNNVQQWQSVRFQILATGSSDDQTIVIGWYDTVTKTNLLSSQTITARHASTFGFAIPTQGPYLDVTITPKNGNATSNFTISLAGLRSIPADFEMLPISIPLISDSTSYAVNQSKLFNPSGIYYGDCYLHVAPQVNAINQVTVARFDLATNNFIPIYQWQSVTVASPLIQRISLPLCLIDVTINNSATGIQTITTTLMPAS